MLLNKPRATTVMRDQGLDGLLASSVQNVFYLSGFWNEGYFVYPRSAQAYALAVKGELEVPSVVAAVINAAAVLEGCPPQALVTHYGSYERYEAPGVQLEGLETDMVDRVRQRGCKANHVEALAAALDERGLTRGVVGYDERGIDDRLVDELRSRLPQLDLCPADATFLRIRAVKTEEEVHRMQAALALTERAMRAVMAMMQPGVTEEEMIREFDRTTCGGGGRPLFTTLSVGRRSALGRLFHGTGTLRRGDVVRIDASCVLQGYCSDLARNFALGDPGERVRHFHAAAVAGEEAAIEAVKPGARASEVFRVGMEAVRRNGIPDYRRQHIGHAIGLEVYEVPILGVNDHTVLEPGMTVNVETPYYELGSAGIQPEDLVLVTEGGPRVLTTLPRQLTVIE